MAALATEVRLGGAGDAPALAALARAAFDPRFGEGWNEAQIVGGLAMPGTWVEIAVVDEAPAGFVMCRRILDEVELLLCASAPAARRRGLARLLLGSAMARGREGGAGRMFLEVRENNAPAQALYRAFGFAEVGRRRNYYRGADGTLFNALSLARAL